MTLLILGVLLWSVVHWFPVFMPTMRAGVISQVGEGLYKGVFTLMIFGSLALIIFGWRSIDPEPVYELDYILRHVMMGMVLASIVLFGAAKGRSRVRRFIRHPMLMGVVLWAIAHLLVNGDMRSIILFGGMFVWAVLSMIGANRRDGAYLPPEPGGWLVEVRLVVISALIYVGLVFGHEYFTGVPLL